MFLGRSPPTQVIWLLLLVFTTKQAIASSDFFADDFDDGAGGTTAKTGDDGTLAWLTKWTGSTANGVTFSSPCFTSSYCLELDSYTFGTTPVSKRTADLSGTDIVSATLTFDYDVIGVTGASNEKGLLHFLGGSNPVLKVATLLPSDGVYSLSIEVPPEYWVPDFKVRFKSVNGAITFIDNIFLEIQRSTPATSETLADNFDLSSGGSTAFGGSDGTIDWSGPWSKVGGLYVTVMDGWCRSGYCLRLITNSNTFAETTRDADLSGFASGTLSFDYRATYADSACEVSVSSNSISTTLGSIPGNSEVGTSNFPIPSEYFTSDFQLKFSLVGSGGWNDCYIDNLVLTVQGTGGGPSPTPPPTPSPSQAPPAPEGTLADNFDLSSGGSTAFGGSDGTIDWSGPWSKVGGLYVTVMDGWCRSGYCLRLITNSNTFAETTRDADLSGFASGTLSFDYRATYADSACEVSVSSNSISTTLGSIPGNSEVGTSNFPIPSEYFTSDFQLKFSLVGSGGWNDCYIDNLVLTVQGAGPPTPPPSPTAPTPTAPTPVPTAGPPPTPVPAPPSGGGGSSAGCGKTGFVPGHQYVDIFSSFTNRRYYRSIPTNYDPNKSYPIIFGMHGRNYNGKDMRNYLRLEETNEADDYIFVYPNGEDKNWPCYSFVSETGWQTGQRNDNEDFILFDDILDEVSNDYCIDLSRVYVTGQSWGGDISSSLPCARGNKIAASVSVASNDAHYFKGWNGNSNYPTIQPSDCQRPVAMMTMKGRTDYSMESYEAADWWYDINECTSPAGNYVKEYITWAGIFEDAGCIKPNIYVMYSNSHTDDHQIPIDYEFTTMDFFAQHSL